MTLAQYLAELEQELVAAGEEASTWTLALTTTHVKRSNTPPVLLCPRPPWSYAGVSAIYHFVYFRH